MTLLYFDVSWWLNPCNPPIHWRVWARSYQVYPQMEASSGLERARMLLLLAHINHNKPWSETRTGSAGITGPSKDGRLWKHWAVAARFGFFRSWLGLNVGDPLWLPSWKFITTFTIKMTMCRQTQIPKGSCALLSIRQLLRRGSRNRERAKECSSQCGCGWTHCSSCLVAKNL